MAVKREVVPIDGAILIWGAATDLGRAVTMERFAVATILTIEEICPFIITYMQRATGSSLAKEVGDMLLRARDASAP